MYLGHRRTNSQTLDHKNHHITFEILHKKYPQQKMNIEQLVQESQNKIKSKIYHYDQFSPEQHFKRPQSPFAFGLKRNKSAQRHPHNISKEFLLSIPEQMITNREEQYIKSKKRTRRILAKQQLLSLDQDKTNNKKGNSKGSKKASSRTRNSKKKKKPQQLKKPTKFQMLMVYLNSFNPRKKQLF